MAIDEARGAARKNLDDFRLAEQGNRHALQAKIREENIARKNRAIREVKESSAHSLDAVRAEGEKLGGNHELCRKVEDVIVDLLLKI
ncbi:MAG: hypothetical protein CVV44_11475 [Spirochaetae bacterium HGW-Spirochaetae-1]|nr:MAG: hypothetical protein CVV44_11475 [Spirochaetae bacterium HGW-Spirochaetae-1]